MGKVLKDYEITVTARNNYLLTAMRAAGFYTAKDLSDAAGVSQAAVGVYLNLKKAPYYWTKKGLRRVSNSAEKIAAVLKVPIENMFPPQHLDKALKSNKSVREADLQEFAELMYLETHAPQALLPDQSLQQKSALEVLNECLAALPARNERIMRLRFGLDDGHPKTYREIGAIIGLSPERVRQIESRSLRRLRDDRQPNGLGLKLAAAGVADLLGRNAGND